MTRSNHKLNGHAYSRCIRAYTITAVALFSEKPRTEHKEVHQRDIKEYLVSDAVIHMYLTWK